MASALIGALRATLGLNTAAFERGSNRAQKEMSKLQKSIKKTGDRFTSMGKNLSLGVTLPLVAFGTGAAKAAIDAEELQASFNQTFGSMAALMNDWAVKTGDAMGRSTQEMQKGAQVLGMFFNQAAPTKQAAADMSQQFTELAQDLASFFNTDFETALGKLRSGLAGEAEPLRDFGVFLNEAAVASKAAEMGIVGVNGKLTDQQKIMARAALIMEATTKAQGDVERTNNSTANQIRRSQAAWQELSVTIGTKLLPALTPIVEKLGKMLEWFSKLSPSTQTFIVAVAALGAAFGPTLMAVGGILKGFGAVLPLLMKMGPAFKLLIPLVGGLGKALLFIAANPVILGLAAVLGGIYLAWKNWDKIKPVIIALYNTAKTYVLDKLNQVWEGVKAGIDRVKGFFRGLWDAVVGHSYIPDMVDGIGAHMARLDEKMVQPAKTATEKTAESFSRLKALLDRLFPDEARSNQFRRELRELEADARATKLPVDQLTEALKRLNEEYLTDQFGAASKPGLEGGDKPAVDVGSFQELGKTAIPVLDGMTDAAKDLARNLNDIAIGGLKDLMRGFGSLKDIALRALYAIGDAIIENLATSLGMGRDSSGGIGGTIASAVSGLLFGGGRALGGPVEAGKAYRVNEHTARSEIFVPSRSGRIVAANDGINIYQTFSPNFAGNAATKEDMLRLAAMVKPMAIDAVREANRRR